MLLRSEAEATVQSLRRQIELLSNKLSVAELAVQNSKKAPRDKPSAEWRINYSREDEESATENLSALMSLLSQGVLVAEERSGAIKRFNAAACDIFDYLPQEMAQLRFKDLVPANFGRPRAAQDPKSIGLRKGIPLGVQRQVSGLRRDGSRLDMDLALTSTKRKDAIIAVFSKCEVA
jgi:PAS domain-containing protein